MFAEQRRYLDAEAAYRRAVALKPEAARAHAALGATLLAQGRWDESAAECREAVRLDGDLGRAHVDLWAALEAVQRYAELWHGGPSLERTRSYRRARPPGSALVAQGARLLTVGYRLPWPALRVGLSATQSSIPILSRVDVEQLM